METSVGLRLATISDAECLLAWRNDSATRSASHHQDEIRLVDHLAWLKASLARSDDRRIWIAEVAGVAVGTCRADKVEGAWELSWTVAPEARGKGIAHQMLSELVKQFDQQPLVAQVKVDNLASMKVAERAGFVLKRDSGQDDAILLYVHQSS
ncbi:GNAT family N-acetyltransferase [Marinomonas sp. A79]|uniref:GNAT family N-acetyltransferase n=1 Tax=Marinomonas vulgaris TaxID=2823372 RepID=A0ABS5H7A9_9GAMM|nr:GNAT family N-acetyltransferase [Marinomonas vulgaris]MBR7887596.1 GNAT family N-acetyltransferase [Marinomonas vulgaris]